MKLKTIIDKAVIGYLNEEISLGIFTKTDVFDAIMSRDFNWHDLYPNYSEEFDEDDETMFETKEKAEQYADYVISTFDSLPNPVPIYRALYSEDENSIDLDYLGESWSMYKESAISFGSHNGSNFLIEATIDKQFVNWEETLNRFVLFSHGDDADDENEIVVREMDKIKDVKISTLRWRTQK